MQAVVTAEAVRRAVQQLENEGTNPSARAILGLTGGSQATVLRLMKEIRESEAGGAFKGEIPAALLDAVRAAMGAVHQEAQGAAEARVAEAESRETAAVEALAGAEAQIEAGETARTEAAKAMLQLERADRTASVAEQRVSDLLAQIDDVKQAAVAMAKAEEAAEVKAELRERIREMERAAEAAAKEIERLQRALTEAIQGRE